MGAEVGADEDRVEDVVDGADDGSSPDSEEGGFAPVAGETEVDGDGPQTRKEPKAGIMAQAARVKAQRMTPGLRGPRRRGRRGRPGRRRW